MKIDIWSDFVCPWCYIGKRRLEAALEEFGEDVELRWHSFQLDPSAPKEATADLVGSLSQKFGIPRQRAQAMMDQITETGASEGLEINFDKALTGNTFEAHRVLHLAGERGLQAQMKERLMAAYFTEGRDVSDVETLVELALEVGLSEEEVRSTLSSDEFEQEVRFDIAQARQIGVTGVPFFLINEKYGVPGAQPPAVLVQALKQAKEELKSTTPEGGPGCDTTGLCEV